MKMKNNLLTAHTVKMTVLSDDEFLSKYCGDEPVISDEVAGYLNNATQAIPQVELGELTIEIKSDEITAEEAVCYERAIHKYYENELAHVAVDLKRNNRASLLMLLCGAAVLGFIIALSGSLGVLNEILDIVGWVFVWEAVDLHFFERFKLRREYLRFYALSRAKINYLPLNVKGK